MTLIGINYIFFDKQYAWNQEAQIFFCKEVLKLFFCCSWLLPLPRKILRWFITLRIYSVLDKTTADQKHASWKQTWLWFHKRA